MGAWIEICKKVLYNEINIVAPHDGCVDWNNQQSIETIQKM